MSKFAYVYGVLHFGLDILLKYWALLLKNWGRDITMRRQCNSIDFVAISLLDFFIFFINIFYFYLRLLLLNFKIWKIGINPQISIFHHSKLSTFCLLRHHFSTQLLLFIRIFSWHQTKSTGIILLEPCLIRIPFFNSNKSNTVF